MTTMERTILEGVRLARAQERLNQLVRPMEAQMELIDELLEVAPELTPEMDAARSRISEMCEHWKSALAVLQAKVELL